jgi:hypothetical protein
MQVRAGRQNGVGGGGVRRNRVHRKATSSKIGSTLSEAQLRICRGEYSYHIAMAHSTLIAVTTKIMRQLSLYQEFLSQYKG